MVSTYVHAEGSETVNVFAVAVVDEYTLNVDWRFRPDVVQPEATTQFALSPTRVSKRGKQ